MREGVHVHVVIPPTTLAARARPDYSWGAGPSSAGLLGAFLLAFGLWLAFGTSPADPSRSQAPIVLAAGASSMLFMIYLARRRRRGTRRELLSDLSMGLIVDLGDEDKGGAGLEAQAEDFRKL